MKKLFFLIFSIFCTLVFAQKLSDTQQGKIFAEKNQTAKANAAKIIQPENLNSFLNNTSNISPLERNRLQLFQNNDAHNSTGNGVLWVDRTGQAVPNPIGNTLINSNLKAIFPLSKK